ncbi:hypothetical protein RB195_008838 [Necator americanus]|uniref:Uncharacterized protein n=1 Tax=Necator americanus TaxID=51031 RepID=A0ABR1CRC3_NECAM
MIGRVLRLHVVFAQSVLPGHEEHLRLISDINELRAESIQIEVVRKIPFPIERFLDETVLAPLLESLLNGEITIIDVNSQLFRLEVRQRPRRQRTSCHRSLLPELRHRT